jgi:GDP-L-fucose synthase
LKKTNKPYAIAKISGIKMRESYNFQYNANYKCLMTCNLYGTNDNYNIKKSLFFPALIAKAIEVKKYKKNYTLTQ